MKGLIFYAKSGGLANRLRALVGYQALSRCLKVPFYLCWVPDWACDAEFADLFELSEIDLITTAQIQSMEERGEVLLYDARLWFSTIWENHLKNTVPWDHFRGHVVACVRGLRVLPHIAHRVDEFSKRHHLHKAVAVHIRFTDNLYSYEHWSKHSPGFLPEHISTLEGFEHFIADSLRDNPMTKILLATDNKGMEQVMRRQFAGQLITYPKRYSGDAGWAFSRQQLKCPQRFQRASSIEEALVEMLLLGRCRVVAGTYWSSYSKFASFWGNTSYVEVRGSRYTKSCFMNRIQGKADDWNAAIASERSHHPLQRHSSFASTAPSSQ